VTGSGRDVEDILLRDGRDKGLSKDSGRTSCRKRSERE
jgi:hypothetical protein